MTLKCLLSAVSVALTAGIVFAVPAAASPEQDNMYFTALTEDGWVIRDPAVMVAQGVAMCSQMNGGAQWRDAILTLVDLGYSVPDSNSIFRAAIPAYCPWQHAVAESADQTIGDIFANAGYY